MSQDRAVVALDQLVLVLQTLEEVRDDIQSVRIGNETVSTRDNVRDWLLGLQRNDDFLHYVNSTGPYADDPPREARSLLLVDARTLAEVKAFLRSGFDRNDRSEGNRLAAKLPDSRA